MPSAHIDGHQVMLDRTDQERLKLVHALNRIEGQVRGVRAMIEAGRYCGDELQQIKAAASGLTRVARLLAEQHIEAANGILLDGASRDIVRADLSDVLKKILSF